MHAFPWMWVFLGMFFWLCFMRPGRPRACQGRWPGSDALIAKLEERVRVPERIATDDSARLRDEIDGLRDTTQR